MCVHTMQCLKKLHNWYGMASLIPSSSERQRKQNNEGEILPNIKMSESELPELPPKAKKAMAQNLNRFCGSLDACMPMIFGALTV